MSVGFRGLAAPWVGGASADVDTTQAGYRSLLALWIGGGAAALSATPPTIVITDSATPRRFYVDPLQAQRLDEDELIVLVITSALPLLH